jgi:DNA polymerase-3 subunit gamma/tau
MGRGDAVMVQRAPLPTPEPIAVTAPAPITDAAAAPGFEPMPQDFAELIALFDKQNEALIGSHLRSHVHLVAFEPGHIEFRPEPAAPRDLASRLIQLLGEWTGNRWVVAVSQVAGAPTIAEDEERRDGELRSEVAAHPLVKAALEAFPGSVITAVRERYAATDPAAEELSPGLEPGDDETGTEEDEP